jgi:CheY-like chemotaxis protein
LAKISVLYVDDEQDFLELTARFLSKSGVLSVDTAPSANAALNMLSTKKYDVLAFPHYYHVYYKISYYLSLIIN